MHSFYRAFLLSFMYVSLISIYPVIDLS